MQVPVGAVGSSTLQAPLGVVTAVADQLVPQPLRVTAMVAPTTGPAGEPSTPSTRTGVPAVLVVAVFAVSFVAVRTVVVRDTVPSGCTPVAATVAM